MGVVRSSLGGVQMLSFLIPRPRRLTRAQSALALVCALSLVIVLASHVPRIPGNEETSWVPSAPSQVTAKVLSKDFFVLMPPASGAITLLHSIPSPLEISEERSTVSISLDNCLFTRPPPSA
jgi:hypothetical protein